MYLIVMEDIFVRAYILLLKDFFKTLMRISLVRFPIKVQKLRAGTQCIKGPLHERLML